MELIFFIEVLAGGLLAGVMYALVALGFVLIYKASGVFNFAQGSMVFFAALTFVSLTERGWNFWLALAATLAVMVLLGVADDHQAALAVGIPLQHIWAIVWAVAGFVALVAGVMWGVRNGVQYALTFVALKALPVLILGGFESILGAIIGGLIIGAGEKLAEGYLGPYVGGGIESWFADVIPLLVLLVRPEGLFGGKHIDRV